MNRWRWPLLLLLICLPVALLATGVRIPWLGEAAAVARPMQVADEDREIAWINTTTNGGTWERFVAGIIRSQSLVPGLQVDDSLAFHETSTTVPELALSMQGKPGKLRIRWYKLRTDVTVTDWVKALSARNPAPLAIIGGGSTDRAVDLAKALEAQKTWRGDRPPLLITTATADRVAADSPSGAAPKLVDLYDGLTFRFCFTNRQMADAVLDFVYRDPELRPHSHAETATAAVASGLVSAEPHPSWTPHVFSVLWNDDPYSTDLHEQFQTALLKLDAPAQLARWDIPFSVGGSTRPNIHEARTAESVVKQLRELPAERALFVLPAVTQPARRLLQTIAENYPRASTRLTVVTGDGIPVNALLRDGEFVWPIGTLAVPMVFFTHNNPVAWDDSNRPPSSTEDAMHYAEMGRIIGSTCFDENGLISGGSVLAKRLHGLQPKFFDTEGERLGGTGEFVVVARPRTTANPNPSLTVWQRNLVNNWRLIDTVPITKGSP